MAISETRGLVPREGYSMVENIPKKKLRPWRQFKAEVVELFLRGDRSVPGIVKLRPRGDRRRAALV